MADLVSALSKMQNAEIESGSIESEIVNQRIGANINGLIDQTDSNETAITDIENTVQTVGSEGTFDVLSGNTLVAASTSIVPVGTNVLISPAGGVFNTEATNDPDDSPSNNSELTTVTLELKRNGTQIFITNQFSQAGMINYSGMVFLDTSATPGVTNTYSLEVFNNTPTDTGTGTLRSLNGRIDLLEF